MATKTNAQVGDYKYFRLQKVIGHKNVNGKKVPIMKSFYGTSKTDATNKYNYWLQHKDDEIVKVDRTRLLEDVAEEFNRIFAVNSAFSQGTRELYISAYKKYLKGSRLASKRVCDLNDDNIQEHYIALKTSKSAFKTYRSYLSNLFKWLHKKGYCENLLELVIIPEKKDNSKEDDIVIFTDEEIRLIETNLKDYELYPIIMFGLYAGLRISEILGLKWSDIHDGQIFLTRQYSRTGFKNCKYNSARTIPLHPKIKEALDNHPHKSKYIFVTASGLMLDHRNVTRSIERAFKRYGMEHKKFHAFRATFCTNLCAKGVSLQTASKLMGHKSVKVTAEFYAKVKSDEMFDAIARL